MKSFLREFELGERILRQSELMGVIRGCGKVNFVGDSLKYHVLGRAAISSQADQDAWHAAGLALNYFAAREQSPKHSKWTADPKAPS